MAMYGSERRRGTALAAPDVLAARVPAATPPHGPYALIMKVGLRQADFATERRLLLERSSSLATRLWRAATSATTLGRERAILRLIGVNGLDREGRPLAAEVVDRYVNGRPGRLAAGIGMPFAMALLEYDTDVQRLALDVAAGSVDLSLEAELLSHPDRRAAAAGHLLGLVAAALDRIDANRVARTELSDLLHDRRPPWIGATLLGSSVEDGEREAAALVRGGLDLIRVEVPTTRELAARLGELGQEVDWRPHGPDDTDALIPAGSQRGLTRLRTALDRAAAERGAYVRLQVAPTALAGPEGAVVAGFERADLLELDPMHEMFVTGVDPERALVDFVFAGRLAARAGVTMVIDASPLVVGPDLGSGVNADGPTWSGRALALQLTTVLVARAAGIPDARIIIGALPGWLAGESGGPSAALAEVAIRRALLPGHEFAFLEEQHGDQSARWAATVAAVQPAAGVALLHPRTLGDVGLTSAAAARARAASEVMVALEHDVDGIRLTGPALDHAHRAITAALATLDLLERDGWAALTGATVSRGGWGRLGADAVAPSGTGIDPVEQALVAWHE